VRNLRVVESLEKEPLKSATEYLIWFTFHNADPVELHVRLGLTEAEQPPEWHVPQSSLSGNAEQKT
jgi:hypothetical protein